MATWSERHQANGERTKCCDYIVAPRNGKRWCVGCGQEVQSAVAAVKQLRKVWALGDDLPRLPDGPRPFTWTVPEQLELL